MCLLQIPTLSASDQRHTQTYTGHARVLNCVNLQVGSKGRCNKAIFEQYLFPAADDCLALICGPPAMEVRTFSSFVTKVSAFASKVVSLGIQPCEHLNGRCLPKASLLAR